jgi:hypothetical protein
MDWAGLRQHVVQYDLHKLAQVFAIQAVAAFQPDRLLRRSLQQVVITFNQRRHGVHSVAPGEKVNRALQLCRPATQNSPSGGGVLSWSSRQVGFHKSQPGDRPASCAQDQAKGYPFLPLDRFWATAARMRSCRAVSLTASPSWRSMARVALASRPALNRPAGSLSEAPLKKLSFT